ncbi:hypothetical protein COO60DRAFT_697126 [Scenedesmus sp. NREL 46B-D3]|nr:hypothetical protein COO60DRAFT_697126 [Scenedesmus sp. NREL 46B-D3]
MLKVPLAWLGGVLPRALHPSSCSVAHHAFLLGVACALAQVACGSCLNDCAGVEAAACGGWQLVSGFGFGPLRYNSCLTFRSAPGLFACMVEGGMRRHAHASEHGCACVLRHALRVEACIVAL